MKKLLMTAALLVVGATAFGATAPVNVSLSVVETSQLVIMDGSQQLNQIDLAHPEILLSSAKSQTSPSIIKKNFRVQTGDGTTPIKVAGADGKALEYTLEGVGTGNELVLTNGTETLNSTLALVRTTETLTAGAVGGMENTITSTIAPNALNGLTVAGTYTGTATLKVIAK